MGAMQQKKVLTGAKGLGVRYSTFPNGRWKGDSFAPLRFGPSGKNTTKAGRHGGIGKSQAIGRSRGN